MSETFTKLLSFGRYLVGIGTDTATGQQRLTITIDDSGGTGGGTSPPSLIFNIAANSQYIGVLGF